MSSTSTTRERRDSNEHSTYRPGYNPEFLRAAKERQERLLTAEKRRAIMKREAEKKAKRKEKRTQKNAIVKPRVEEKGVVIYSLPIGPSSSGTPIGGDITAAFIIANFCRTHGIAKDVILGTSRKRHIAYRRHQLMYEIKAAKPSLSLPYIGSLFGKDHTTILHGISGHAARNGLPQLTSSKHRTKL